MNGINSRQSSSTTPSRECEEAIKLAIELLMQNEMEPALYKLIVAQNLITGDRFVSPHAWGIIFKLRRAIPDSVDAEIGAGGEVFVEVDIVKREARLLGHGE